MRQEHHPKQVKSYHGSADTDTNKELLGQQQDGRYYDARNARNSNYGDKGAVEKIGGEELFHDIEGVDNPDNFVSLGSTKVRGKLISIHADSTGTEDPVITIDGVIVAQSASFPFLYNRPVALHFDNDCEGGRFVVTRKDFVPMLFDVTDMLDSVGTEKYFSEFNIEEYTINLSVYPNIPVFKELVNVGGGGGLPVGDYQYQIRFSTGDGDRSNWSVSTPTIPVLRSLYLNDNQYYPGIKSYGGPANPDEKTSYGIKIKFRVVNDSDYEFLEIKRIANNSGTGFNSEGVSTVVARIPIDPGEIGIYEFTDPAEQNTEEPVPVNEDVNNLSIIKGAQDARFYRDRLVLMNYNTESRDITPTFKEINGKKAVAINEDIGKLGHNDPWNDTYRKDYMAGEKYGFAVDLYDGLFAQSFAAKIDGLENFQFPNRRDKIDPDAVKYSTGQVRAATVDGDVDDTYESFDLEDSVKKVQEYGFRLKVAHNESYSPLSPVNQNDSDISGYQYNPNRSVDGNTNILGDSRRGNPINYNPKGFAPEYKVKGLLFPGIEKSSLPDHIRAFAVKRTRAAGRVVCQGLAFYGMNIVDFPKRPLSIPGVSPLDGSIEYIQGGKLKNTVFFYAKDVDAGYVPGDFVDQLNSGSLQIQMVSPLGMFNEVYSNAYTPFIADSPSFLTGAAADMVIYPRIIRDTTGNPQIIAGQANNMGIKSTPDDGYSYVSYGKWRNQNQKPGYSSDGNRLFTIQSAQLINDGNGGLYYKITLNEDIYVNTLPQPQSDEEYIGVYDQTTLEGREMNEPVYIANIVRTGANVQDENIQEYQDTGTFQKIESLLGIHGGGTDQSFELVDERWEDCISAIDPANYDNTEERFVFIRNSDGDQKWMDVTHKSQSDIDAIMQAINNDGFYNSGTDPEAQDIRGIYTFSEIGNKTYQLVFNQETIPSAGDQIIVKYDERIPIKVFGGDCIVSENTWSIFDRQFRGMEADPNTVVIPYGFPYTSMQNSLISREDPFMMPNNIFRQLVVMFCSQNRVNSQFAYNDESTTFDRYFPLVNYVGRPWRYTNRESNKEVNPSYENDYPNENLRFGGLKTRQQINVDYSKESPINSFSKARVGFTEETEFCTGTVWSLKKRPGGDFTPGLKTFNSLNSYIAETRQGEFKKAYSFTSPGKGSNLYGIAEYGVCLLLSGKNILSNIQGDDLTTVATDAFISGEYWLDRNIGSDKEFWTTFAEDSLSFTTEGGNVEKEGAFWASSKGVFMFIDNVISDISRDNYRQKLNPVLKDVLDGYADNIKGVVDTENREYFLQIKRSGREGTDSGGNPVMFIPPSFTFAYNFDVRGWNGFYDYQFDSYICLDGKVYGIRELKVYELDRGFIINGEPVVFEVVNFNNPDSVFEKEFIYFQANSNVAPDIVEFLDGDLNVLCSNTVFKKYDGWERWIPRKDVSVSPDRLRLQDRLMGFRIKHEKEGRFVLPSTVTQYKIIK